MNQQAVIVISFVVIALVLGYLGMEMYQSGGHWQDAGSNWSR